MLAACHMLRGVVLQHIKVLLLLSYAIYAIFRQT
jgi:hypothetical protein